MVLAKLAWTRGADVKAAWTNLKLFVHFYCLLILNDCVCQVFWLLTSLNGPATSVTKLIHLPLSFQLGHLPLLSSAAELFCCRFFSPCTKEEVLCHLEVWLSSACQNWMTDYSREQRFHLITSLILSQRRRFAFLLLLLSWFPPCWFAYF